MRNAIVLMLAALATPALADGTVKGRLVWPAKVAIPENPEAKVDKDRKHCLSKGKVHRDELIVHPKNQGIKNAAFWLVDLKSPLRPFP